jgi:hypothetical protein
MWCSLASETCSEAPRNLDAAPRGGLRRAAAGNGRRMTGRTRTVDKVSGSAGGAGEKASEAPYEARRAV